MSQNVKWQRIWRRFKVLIILAIAVFSFAILGLFQGSDFLSAGGAAAMVNGKPVTIAEFRQAVNNLEQRMGDSLNSLPAQQRQMWTSNIRRQALTRLIQERLMSQAASNESIYVSDSELIDYISNIPAFQENGRFSRQIYQNYLTATRNSAADFEVSMKRQLLMNRLRMTFGRAVTPVASEAGIQNQAKNTQVEIQFVNLTDAFNNKTYTSKQLKAFQTEQLEKVTAYYEKNKKMEFSIQEEVKARHILARFNKGDSNSEKAAQSKINELLKGLTVAEFSKVAKEKSEDPGSAKKGGDLGYFGRGAMVPEFEKAAFGAKAGEIVGPIKSAFGFHLIVVDEKKPAGIKSLDEVKGDIAKKLIAKQALEDASAELKEALASNSGSKVRKVLKSRGIKFENTGKFSLSQTAAPKLSTYPKVVSAALGVKAGQFSTELVKNNGKVFVVGLKSLKSKHNTASTEELRKSTFNIGGQRANQAMTDWIKLVEEASEVVPNEQLFVVN